MRQAREARERRLDLARGDAHGAGGGIGGAGVLVVMRAGQAAHATQVDRGDLPPLAVFGQEALAREHRPAETLELFVHGNADHPVVLRRLRHLARKVPPLGLVHADHAAIRPALGKEPPLGREVAADSAMPVQMVGRKVGEHRHVRRQRAGKVGLIARQFQHHHLAVLRRVERQDPGADVAPHLRRPPGLRQDVVDQRGGRGLAVRPGDADHARGRVERVPPLAREAAEKQADVVVHRHAARVGLRDRGVRRGIEMRDPRRGDERVDRPLPPPVAGQVDERQPLRLGRRAGLGAVIPGNDVRPAGGQRRGGRPPGAAEAENGNGLTGDALDGDHARLLSVGLWDRVRFKF